MKRPEMQDRIPGNLWKVSFFGVGYPCDFLFASREEAIRLKDIVEKHAEEDARAADEEMALILKNGGCPDSAKLQKGKMRIYGDEPRTITKFRALTVVGWTITEIAPPNFSVKQSIDLRELQADYYRAHIRSLNSGKNGGIV